MNNAEFPFKIMGLLVLWCVRGWNGIFQNYQLNGYLKAEEVIRD